MKELAIVTGFWAMAAMVFPDSLSWFSLLLARLSDSKARLPRFSLLVLPLGSASAGNWVTLAKEAG